MAVYVATPPKRTHQQRIAALARANYVRTLRADLKRDIRAGVIDPCEILVDPPEWAKGMYVIDVLLCMRAVGRKKAGDVLRVTNSSPHKTIGGLTDRQKDEIHEYMEGRRR